jgi:hypothetical protein
MIARPAISKGNDEKIQTKNRRLIPHHITLFITTRPVTMRLSNILFASLAIVSFVLGAQSFPGSNLYCAAGLTSDQQDTLFSGLESAGIKALRVWLDGISSLPVI